MEELRHSIAKARLEFILSETTQFIKFLKEEIKVENQRHVWNRICIQEKGSIEVIAELKEREELEEDNPFAEYPKAEYKTIFGYELTNEEIEIFLSKRHKES